MVSDLPGDLAEVEGSFRIPSRVAPGDYLVRLSVVGHGRMLHSETARLSVPMTGLPAFLISLAAGTAPFTACSPWPLRSSSASSWVWCSRDAGLTKRGPQQCNGPRPAVQGNLQASLCLRVLSVQNGDGGRRT
jgi:hypothetical protein